ncbi:MAG: hypothetical protein C0454_02155 [Parvibaculum sp.]|nr:hypothetical protein [Parvibaculum sp.]
MKKYKAAKLIYRTPELRALLRSPGGTARKQALARASENVCHLSADLLPALYAELERAEEIVAAAPDPLPPSSMRELFECQSVIYNLAGTFGETALQRISANLSDLLADMIERGSCPSEPVHVHLRAAHMFAPGMPHVSEEALAMLLNHLASIRAFLRDGTREKMQA